MTKMKTLVKLRAKKARKYYKSDGTYLRAVSDNNKEWLTGKATYTPTKATLRQSFVKNAMNYINQGYTAKQAANMVASSADFAGKHYRSKINIYNVIMNDKKLYSKFKSMANIKNKKEFNIEKLRWDYFEQAYTYDNKFYIDTTNSPYGVFLIPINDWDSRALY